jgi:hypothetical protein
MLFSKNGVLANRMFSNKIGQKIAQAAEHLLKQISREMKNEKPILLPHIDPVRIHSCLH